jgi:Ran GTPase-activating protein (RanGAP) involved in mRNA processing and transport
MPKPTDTEELEWAYPDSVSNCMKEIKGSGSAVSFSWCDPKLGESGEAIDELCSHLSKSKKIQALDLDNMNLSDSSVEAICESLKKNKSLHTLVLSNNDLGANSAKAIDALLKLNKTIKKINLDGNKRIPAHLMEPITTQLASRA